MSDLVQRLCAGTHPVVAKVHPDKAINALRERIQQGFVHVRFLDTKGGTELGVRLDPAATDLSRADFEAGIGEVKLVGSLQLDYVKVNCVATIDLATLEGQGHLELGDSTETVPSPEAP